MIHPRGRNKSEGKDGSSCVETRTFNVIVQLLFYKEVSDMLSAICMGLMMVKGRSQPFLDL